MPKIIKQNISPTWFENVSKFLVFLHFVKAQGLDALYTNIKKEY